MKYYVIITFHFILWRLKIIHFGTPCLQHGFSFVYNKLDMLFHDVGGKTALTRLSTTKHDIHLNGKPAEQSVIEVTTLNWLSLLPIVFIKEVNRIT